MAILTEPNLSGRGKREELADMIALVDARDTPFVSMARKGSKPGNMLFQWQADTNPQPQVGGTVDGTDVNLVTGISNYVVEYRKQLGNYGQIFRRATGVSKLSQDLADVAGVRDSLSDNVSKAIIGLKRDMEVTMTSIQSGQADNGTIPYLTCGIQKWTNGDASIGTGLPSLVDGALDLTTPSTSRQGSGSAAANLTDTLVQSLLKSIFDITGQYKSFDCIVGTDLKRAFTGLLGTTSLTTTSTVGVTGVGATKVQTFTREASADTYIQSMDVFQGDFGTVRLHPTTFLGAINSPSTGLFTTQGWLGLVLDMSQIEIRYGGNVAQVTALPDAGAGPRRLVEAVAGLVVGNPKGLGKFTFTAA
jgi:hypothetical protein